MRKNPSLQVDFERTHANRELYKDFVRNVLNADQDEAAPLDEEKAEENEKYIGNASFTDMSKKIGDEWQKVDELTRTILIELAEEGEDNGNMSLFHCSDSFYKRVLPQTLQRANAKQRLEFEDFRLQFHFPWPS